MMILEYALNAEVDSFKWRPYEEGNYDQNLMAYHIDSEEGPYTSTDKG